MRREQRRSSRLVLPLPHDGRAELMGKTSIEWTDVTWNPVRGCSRVSEGCRNCYAERMAARFSEPPPLGDAPFYGYAEMTPQGPRWTGRVELIPSKVDEPLRWKRPCRVFVNSMSDLFHEALTDDAIDQVFAVMALAIKHTFQILTKRPERMRRYFSGAANGATRESAVASSMDQPSAFSLPRGRSFPRFPAGWPLPNVWVGVSCEDQQRADERIPLLLQTPAAVRFVSLEPLLSAVDLTAETMTHCNFTAENPVAGECEHGLACRERSYLDYLDLIIVGGESGPNARPCDVRWIRSIVQQCREAGVPCFCKQLGARPFVVEGSDDARSWAASGAAAAMDDCGQIHTRNPKGGDPEEWPEDLRVRQWPEVTR